MASSARVVTIRVLGDMGQYTRSIEEAGLATEGLARKTASTFDKQTTLIGGSFSKLGALGASFGLPFTGALTSLGDSLDKTSVKSKSFASTLSAVGGVEALAVGAALLVVGTSAVKAAGDFDTAQAQLQAAIKDTGSSFDTWQGQIQSVNDKMEHLGYTNAQTEQSMSKLVEGTGNVTKATQLMGLAADISRARNLSLDDSVALLVKTNAGFYATLHRTLGVTTEQIKSFHDTGDALDFLANKFGGQAQAHAETFNGKLEVLKATATDLEKGIGNGLIPIIEGIASGTVSAVNGLETANKATDGWLGKVSLGVAAVPLLAFAMDKLGSIGATIGSSFERAGQSLGSLAGVSDRAAAENARLAESEESVAISTAKSAAARASIPGLERAYAANAEAQVTAQAQIAGSWQATTGVILESERIRAEALAVDKTQAGWKQDLIDLNLQLEASEEKLNTIESARADIIKTSNTLTEQQIALERELATARELDASAAESEGIASASAAASTSAGGAAAAAGGGARFIGGPGGVSDAAAAGGAAAVASVPIEAAAGSAAAGAGTFGSALATGIETAGAAISATFAAVSAAAIPVGAAMFAVHTATKDLSPDLNESAAAVDHLTKAFTVLAQSGNSNALVQEYGKNFQGLSGAIADAAHQDDSFWETDRKHQNQFGPGNLIVEGIKKIGSIFGEGGTTGHDDDKKTIDGIQSSLSNLYKTDPSTAVTAFQLMRAQFQAGGGDVKKFDEDYKGLSKTLGTNGSTDAATLAQNKLNIAIEKYKNDKLTPGTSQGTLATDAQNVTVANQAIVASQNAVNVAMQGSQGPIDNTSYSWLNLTKTVKDAKSALDELYSETFGTIKANISVDDSKAKLDDAEHALTAPANGQTPTANALDHRQKELALRDALLSVSNVEGDVASAETNLAAARNTQIDAVQTLVQAEKDYNITLNGVAAGSLAAVAAVEALASAQNTAAQSSITARDANRSLQQLQNDAPLKQFAVIDAQKTLTTDQNSGLNPEQIRKDEIALRDAQIAASGSSDAIKAGSLSVSAAKIKEAQDTAAATAQHKLTNEILHGYAATSLEAQAASKALRDAQIGVQTASEGLTSAMRGLVTAHNEAATSALALDRAEADLQDKLNSADYKSANQKLDEHRAKIDAVKTAALELVQSTVNADIAAGHSVGFAIRDQIQILEDFAAANPAIGAAFTQALQKLDQKIVQQEQHDGTPLGGPGQSSAGANQSDKQRQTIAPPPAAKTWHSFPISEKSKYPGGHADGNQWWVYMKEGGPIGSGSSAGIPVMAHPNEYMINAKSVAKYGLGTMDAINAGTAALPTFAAGGAISPSASSGTGTTDLITSFSQTTADAETAGSDLLTGFYLGAKQVFDETLNPFMTGLKEDTVKATANSKTWLVQPGSDMMSGLWAAVQAGYVPTQAFFKTGLANDISAGAVGAVTALTSAWGGIGKAFADPGNFAISDVLNPLIDDVNEIGKAVGIGDIFKGHLKPLVGSFETGGVIPDTGLALVHKGEGVIPAAAMQNLTQQEFQALQTGKMAKDIKASIAAESQQSGAGTGAAKVVDALVNKLATGAAKYVDSLKAVVQASSFGGGGGGGGGTFNLAPGEKITPNDGGFAGALANARIQSRLTGIPVSVMLTQSADETGDWTSSWYRDQNNPAGIGVTGVGAAGNGFLTLADGWASYAQHLLGNGEAGQEQFISDLHAGASALQLLKDIEMSPWAAGHYNGHDLESIYPSFAAYKDGGFTGPGNAGGFPALLHPNEFVVNANSVAKYGVGTMDAINKGTLDAFDDGGFAGKSGGGGHRGGGGAVVNNRFEVHISMLDATNAEPLIRDALQNITKREGYVRGVAVAL